MRTRIWGGLFTMALATTSVYACSDTPSNDDVRDPHGSGDASPSDGAPGDGALPGDEDSGAGGDSSSDAGQDAPGEDEEDVGVPVTIRFAAKVGAEPFACGGTFSGVGTPPRAITPVDFRFYLHDVRVVDDGGNDVPVTLRQRSLWQHADVVLIDFEDRKGACTDGDAIVNDVIVGGLPAGVTPRGLKFRMGVPQALNHADLSSQPPPLDKNSLFWAWQSGHIFFAAVARARLPMGDAGEDAGTIAYDHYTHLGAVSCNGNPAIGVPVTTCLKPNRPEYVFADFDPSTNVVVADLAAVKDGTDLAGPPCHAETDACTQAYTSLGIDWATGGYLDTQSLFRVE